MTQPSLLNPAAPPHVFIQRIPPEASMALVLPFLTHPSTYYDLGQPTPGRTRVPMEQCNTAFQLHIYSQVDEFTVFPSGPSLDTFVDNYCESCPYFFTAESYEEDGFRAYRTDGDAEVRIVGTIYSPCPCHSNGIDAVEVCIEHDRAFVDAVDRPDEPEIVGGTPLLFSTTYRLSGYPSFDPAELKNTNHLIAARHHAAACAIGGDDADDPGEERPIFTDGTPICLAPDRITRSSSPKPVFNCYDGLDICWGSQSSLLWEMPDAAAALSLFNNSPCNTDLNSIDEVTDNIDTALHSRSAWQPDIGSSRAIAIQGGGVIAAVAIAMRESSPAAYMQAIAMGGICSGDVAVIPLASKASHRHGPDPEDGYVNGWVTFPDDASRQWFIADEPLDRNLLRLIPQTRRAYGFGKRGLLCGQVHDPDMITLLPSP